LIETRSDFKFTLDGFWVAEQFLAGRDERQRVRFRKAVQDRRILVPAVYGSVFTGFASLENLFRSFYPSRRFLGELGLPLEFALITDVPSYSWSWASVFGRGERCLPRAVPSHESPA
jgi:alpha-mannosidase